MSQAPISTSFRRGIPALATLLLLSVGAASAGDKAPPKDKPATLSGSKAAIAQTPPVIAKKAPVAAISARDTAKATLKNDGRQPGEIRDGSSQTKAAGELPGSTLPAKPVIDRGQDKTETTSGQQSDESPAERLGELPKLRDGTSTTTLLEESADRNAKPGFDQGFGTQATVDAKLGAAATAGRSGNPLGALTGSTIGGPLGDAAANAYQGGKGLAGQGTAAVADDSGCSGDRALCDAMSAVAKDKSDDKSTGARKDTVVKSDVVDGVSETITHERPDGHKTVIERDFANHKTTITDTQSGKTTKEVLDDKTNRLKTPDPEGRRKPTADDLRNRLNDRNFQIVQSAKQNGATNPTRGDDATGNTPVAGAIAPSQTAIGHQLFGQPGQADTHGGGAPSSGGLDFNGSLGAIDPGDEQTVTAGNRQEDPGAVFDHQPGAQFPTSTSSSDDEDDDEKASDNKTTTP